MAKAIRWQILLEKNKIEMLQETAEKIGWSVSALACDILAVAVEDHKSFVRWIENTIGRALIVQPAKLIKGRKKSKKGEEKEYLQVMLTEDTAGKVTQCAQALGRRPTELAAELMRFAIEDSYHVNQIYHSRWGKVLRTLLDKYGIKISPREKPDIDEEE